MPIDTEGKTEMKDTADNTRSVASGFNFSTWKMSAMVNFILIIFIRLLIFSIRTYSNGRMVNFPACRGGGKFRGLVFGNRCGSLGVFAKCRRNMVCLWRCDGCFVFGVRSPSRGTHNTPQNRRHKSTVV